MGSNFRHHGDKMEYINTGSAIVANQIVQVGAGPLVGMAEVDIANGESGTLLLRGVVQLTLEAATSVTQGDLVDWSNAGSEVVGGGLGDFNMGYALNTVGPGGVVEVRLLNS